MRAHHLLPALLLLASCSSDPSQELVGTWRGHNGDFLTTVTFAADGTFTETASNRPDNVQTRTGQWRFTGSSMFIKTLNQGAPAPAGFESEDSSYLAGDTLVRGAFVPVGAHKGVIGTWRRRQALAEWEPASNTVAPQVVLEGTLSLREDGTTHMELRLGEDLRVIAGSWRMAEGGLVELSVDRSSDNTFQQFPLRLIDDAVLGSSVMTRQ